MKNQETGIIEGSIATEENFSPDKKPVEKPKLSKIPKIQPREIFENLKKKILYFKRPKFITIIILFLSIITIYVSLVVFLSKQPIQNQNKSVVIPNSTPQINTKELPAEINNKKNVYYKDLEILDSDLGNTTFPQVDLNITF